MRQDPRQTHDARLLRQNLVLAEQALWQALRNRGLGGLKFRRQAPIGAFIVDFLCVERRLILEIDAVSPPARAAWLKAQGFRLLHLQPTAILTNLPGCLQHLAQELSL
ncbi:hypothetical protein GCM10010873_15900 [Cypionkella aquatica]|uniref:DUF559 domain-containing protein n=1 Tax=Cypionkella aquatica TaxID=1756042 RepID=A0AA37X321_9RHOB|nr:DUF559 domain-containing protein [Cypionkella aquatica]GLS86616.1 hypothetical protein GCM10010873_15900 [Cypionkella aquatica]